MTIRAIIFGAAMTLAASPAFAENSSNGPRDGSGKGTNSDRSSGSGAYDPNAPTLHTYSGGHTNFGGAVGGEYGGIGINGRH